MKNYNMVKEALKEGQQITIVSTNSFGFMYVLQTVYKSCEPAQHYQNCPENMIGVAITHKPKRKRSYYKTTIDYNADFIIYDGWQNIDTDKILYTIENKDGVEIRKSKYTSFDVRNFEDCIKLYGKGVVTCIR